MYLDDIFIYSTTIEEHEQHLQLVFEVLRTHCFFLSKNKVDLYSVQMDCLGHMIDDMGIHVNMDKMKLIREWPRPLNYNDVQRFNGVVNYISQFMPDVTAYTSPLAAMSKQAVWTWNPIHEQCFNQIKHMACRAPILKPIDPSKTDESIFVVCDASVTGVGAMYGQGKSWQTCRPAGFLSKKFSNTQSSYRTYEQETLAILEGLSRWEDKLLGRKITIVTDHETLEYFNTQERLSNRQVRWYEYLSRFHYDIVYIEGIKNVVADALSRYYTSLPKGQQVPEDVYVNIDAKLDPEGVNLPLNRGLEMRAARIRKI